MRKFLFSILLLSCAILSFAQYGGINGDDSWVNKEYNTTEGTEFWVTFMSNSGAAEGDMETMKLYLYATARENAQVTIHNPRNYESPIVFDVSAGQQMSYQIPNEWAYINTKEANTITNRGIQVSSTKPISLYATNQHKSGKYDATNILPSSALMGEYVVQTYRADVYATEFAIIATRSQTITINIKKTTINQDKYNNGIIDTIGLPEEYRITKSFYAGQTYLFRATEKQDGGNNIETSTSLSGTTLCSDAPFAVFVGGQSAKISADPENHIFAQAYPTDKWGKNFYVAPTYGMVYDFVQFTACKNNTQLRKNGVLVATLGVKDSYIDTLKSVLQYKDDDAEEPTYTPVPAFYTTTQPTECFLYGTGYAINHPLRPNGKENLKENTEFGAPVLTPVIPQELAMKSTMFATFTKTNTELKHYVNIVTPTDEVSGMRLDNTNISTDFKPIQGSTYSYAIKEVSNKAHKIENVRDNPNSTFTARVYGLGASSSAKESYAYVVGSRVSRKADLLINGQYVKTKTICVTQSLNFKGLVEGDYTSIDWNFNDDAGVTTKISNTESIHQFSQAGDYDIELIVTRPYPYICSHSSGLGQNGKVTDYVHATIHVKDKYESSFHKKICEGTSVELKGLDENGNVQTITYDHALHETKHFYTVDGCDSIVDVKIEVGHPETKTIQKTECNEFEWHGTVYKESGTHEWKGQNEYGCEVTEILNLTILKPVTGPVVKKTICNNSFFDWNGQRVDHADTYNATLKAANGCDSIATLVVEVEDEYREELTETLCHGQTYRWRGQTLSETKTYTEKATSANGCDSTFILHLSFYPDYSNIQVEDHFCEGSSYWFGNEEITKEGTYTKQFTSKIGGCDSIVTLTLDVWPSENQTIVETRCANDPYFFNGEYLSRSGTYVKTETTENGCTKTTTLELTVNPVTEKYDTIRICDKALPYTYAGQYIANKAGDYTQKLDITNQYGCDSIYHLHLIVDEAIVTHFDIHRCEEDGPYSHPDPETTKLHNLTQTGIYRDTLQAVNSCDSVIEINFTMGKRTYYTWPVSVCDNSLPWIDPNTQKAFERDTMFNDTILNASKCDSVITVQFHVNRSYETPVKVTICDKDAPYNHPDPRATQLQGLSSSGIYKQTLQTVNGCDSTIILDLTINPVTYYHQYKLICQEALPYEYGDNGKKALTGGDYSDVLNTLNQYGCDSVLVLHLTVMEQIVDQQYVTLCDNELPYNHPDPRATNLQNLTQSNTYYQTLKTIAGCDSVIELHLQVWPTYEVDDKQTICANEQYDFNGHLFAHMSPREEPYRFDTLMKTVHGCDSLVHFALTVYPTYEFITQAKICANENYFWRNKWYSETGVYCDSFYTHDHHCDSVYVLELYKKPTLMVVRYDTICDNETYVHTDTIWYTNGTHVPVETMVWTPGMDIPQSYSDITFRSLNDACDSVIYRYYLKINPSFSKHETGTICSNQPLETESHVYTGYEFEWEPGEYSPPLDTLIENIYTSVNGCDSSYFLHATLFTAYRHIDRRTMCDNETISWRGHQYTLPAGYYTFRDSFLTVHLCDSIYELQLTVNPSFLFEERLAKCVDEDVTWHNQPLDQLPAGSYFYFDSTTTVLGCDSVYHLYLTVNDTTSESVEATICKTETYDFHGVPLVEPGYYADTTLNEWGCKHRTHLYLDVIEPTVPKAWADSICADDNAYELFYTYTGRDPIAYSLFYDDEGHFYGFEDIINEPIPHSSFINHHSSIIIPMPLRNKDRTQYPKPNHYHIKLVLDNGICVNPDLCSTDTSIVLSYPSWITRQRFGDVIALYNEKYNGNYIWSHYQWYHGDTLLVGETHEYLYVPTGLVVGDQYHVRLTREGETQDFQTCPITIVADPIENDFAPEKGYLSVVPTCIVSGHPYANILSRKDGYYRITSIQGLFIKEGVFRADVTQVKIPATHGLYLFQLWSPDTPEEPYRAIKVLVSPVCETCNMPF